jgi:hypothetical protein
VLPLPILIARFQRSDKRPDPRRQGSPARSFWRKLEETLMQHDGAQLLTGVQFTPTLPRVQHSDGIDRARGALK